MDVSEYKFDDNEIQRLHEHRDNQPDVRLRVRFIAMLMLAEGIELKTIASVIGKSIKTIENWHHQYVAKGIESLNAFQYKPKQSYLTEEQIDQVAKWVKETNPGKTKEVREYIKRHFQVAYTNEAVRKIMKKRGLRFCDPRWSRVIHPAKRIKKKHRTIFRDETHMRDGNSVLIRRWNAFGSSKYPWTLLGRSQRSTDIENQYRP